MKPRERFKIMIKTKNNLFVPGHFYFSLEYPFLTSKGVIIFHHVIEHLHSFLFPQLPTQG